MCIRSTICTGIYQDISRCSQDVRSSFPYRENYKIQVYHTGCQVIARQESDIRQVIRNSMVNISTSNESTSSDIEK